LKNYMKLLFSKVLKDKGCNIDD